MEMRPPPPPPGVDAPRSAAPPSARISPAPRNTSAVTRTAPPAPAPGLAGRRSVPARVAAQVALPGEVDGARGIHREEAGHVELERVEALGVRVGHGDDGGGQREGARMERAADNEAARIEHGRA